MCPARALVIHCIAKDGREFSFCRNVGLYIPSSGCGVVARDFSVTWNVESVLSFAKGYGRQNIEAARNLKWVGNCWLEIQPLSCTQDVQIGIEGSSANSAASFIVDEPFAN